MDGNTVVFKTPRGREEIGSRAHDLDSLSRRLLIMADGTRTIADLATQLDRAPNDAALVAAVDGLLAGRYLHTPDDYHQPAPAAWPLRAPARARRTGSRSALAAPLGNRDLH